MYNSKILKETEKKPATHNKKQDFFSLNRVHNDKGTVHMMKKGIKGFQSVSSIEYPDTIASIVFFSGCNFRCPFCHNKELVFEDEKRDYFDTYEILDKIKERKKIIDGISITGGEPTLCPWIGEFIKCIKQMDLKVKLDTNGTMPKVLEKLLDEKLLDYIAMDIKAPKEKYNILSGIKKPNMNDIEKSITIIKESGIDYEFRTTVIPKYHTMKDMINIAKWIEGANKYFIQQFRGINTLDSELEKEKSYSIKELKDMQKKIEPYFGICQIKGI